MQIWCNFCQKWKCRYPNRFLEFPTSLKLIIVSRFSGPVVCNHFLRGSWSSWQGTTILFLFVFGQQHDDVSAHTHSPTFQNSPVARKRFNIECLETAWELVNVQFKINRSIWGYLEASSWQFWSRGCVSSISSCLFVSNEAVILSKQMCYASKCQNNLRTAFQNTLTQHN